LAALLGCGLRRAELVALKTDDLQMREDHWIIADLIGKGKHIRTVPVPSWVKTAIDQWTAAAGIATGAIFRRVNRMGGIWGDGITPKAIWHVVKRVARRAGIEKLAPHDLRRTCARLCHLAGGELEQIQFLLGHVSVQTTERYLGCKQKLRNAVNDNMGLEPWVRQPPRTELLDNHARTTAGTDPALRSGRKESSFPPRWRLLSEAS
jgi:integrase